MLLDAGISDIVYMKQGQSTATPQSDTPLKTGNTTQAPKPSDTTANVFKILSNLTSNIQMISDPAAKQTLTVLLNLVERQTTNVAVLQEKNQELKDEINRLKGEQGKPTIKASKKDGDISSEKERNSRKTSKPRKKRGPKLNKIKVHKIQIQKVNKQNLPADVEFKGYQSVVIQDLIVRPENTEFKREVYYSPSKGKTYLASLPEGYDGEFGPGIRSFTLAMKYVCNISEPKILEFYQEHDVVISSATISRLLTKKLELFHLEKAELFAAGLASSSYQQIDDTSARVNGQNWYTQIVCNDLYAAFFTTKRKDRLTILDVLRQFDSRTFLFNDETASLLETLRVPQHVRRKVAELASKMPLNENEMETVLRVIFPDPNKGQLHRARVKEAAAISAYHQETGTPIVKILVCDDAPQFKLLTEKLGLCWVHDGRHYKKLMPVVPHNADLLQAFRERYWDFYANLLIFKENPSEQDRAAISKEFDELFDTKTGYEDLDNRISKTRAKKSSLLMVLSHPELPLHNNGSELEARVAARRRDVSLHTRTKEGTAACDTMTSIVRTAKKLGQSAFKYIQDRVSGAYNIPSLADQISARARPSEIECET